MAQANWAVREARERSDTPRHLDLLDAAARVFVERGYSGATAAAITAQAGVSRPTFYVYFASREEIFAALAARVRDDFLAAQEPEHVADSPAEMLAVTVRSFAAAVHTHGALLTLIEQRAVLDPAIAALADEINERPILRFTKYLDRQLQAGLISPTVPNRVVAETIGHTLTRGILARLDATARAEFEGHMIAVGLQLLGIAM
ncbi:TetR/AcrR family transcriptional regulator [Smaragdicoccus niigatensis]|uniref:TetR/AcrR family transcriptional regulator n=1 Tax=Smaragdicoccus niigatensis TaxID=359359 RepID=UPI0003769056|nr:TetR/AcrR family transcriptional regulator [Smaragdicoccus niigatensis]